MIKRSILLFVLPLMLLVGLMAPQSIEAGNASNQAKLVNPNPFTEGTTFQLTMPKSARIRISVYDLLGQLVRTLHDGIHPEGQHDKYWDGKDLYGNPVPPGIYICVLFSEDVAVKSVKVIKAQS